MLIGACGNLRRMRHRHHLHLSRKPRQPCADGVGHGTPYAGVDLVEHQRRRGSLVGQHHFQRQQETRQLAAGGDLHQRSRPGAGIGLHPELDAIEPLRPRRGRIRIDLGHEFCALEFQRRQFGVDRLVEFFRRLRARRRQFRSRRCETLVGLGGLLLQHLQAIRAGVDQRDIGGVFGGERGEPVHRRRIFARRGAQREQPLLDAFQLGRVEVGGCERRPEVLIRFLQRVDGGVDRLDRRLDQLRRTRGTPFQPAHRRRKRRDRRMVAADRLLRLAQIAGDLLALHHDGAAFGERSLFAVAGCEFFQFIGGVAEIVGFARGALHAGAVLVERRTRGTAGFPQRFLGGDIALQPGEGIQQPPVRRGIDKRPLVVLAVNFHQCRADRLQRLHADRLIVDEGAGAAVGKLHPPQYHLARLFGHGVVDIVGGQDRRGRMTPGNLEGGGDLALLRAVTDQPGIAAAA